MVDGATPYAGLIWDKKGISTARRSTADLLTADAGVVFKLERATKTETVLYSFGGAPDGGYPYGPLIRDLEGNLYGTTITGGSFDHGMVFKLDAGGNNTALYSFTGGLDGAAPGSGLLRDTQGNLYGTTVNGGSLGHGVVFKLDPTGNETVLHDFNQGIFDGFEPRSGLTRDAVGNFYGTTTYGETGGGNGTVYKLTPDGTFTLLHSFTWGADGAFPWAGVILDKAGNLYGTTTRGGGSCDCGVVFKITP